MTKELLNKILEEIDRLDNSDIEPDSDKYIDELYKCIESDYDKKSFISYDMYNSNNYCLNMFDNINPPSIIESDSFSTYWSDEDLIAEGFDKHCPNFNNRIVKIFENINPSDIKKYSIIGLKKLGEDYK